MSHTDALTRAAPLRADSWNAETWTFDIVMSTGAPVDRQDSRGVFSEVLNTAGATWPDTIPLLDSHRRSSLDDQIGEVSNIRLEGGAVIGTARLSKHSPRAQRLAAELSDGQRYGGSIGYAVPETAWAETKAGPKRTKTATTFNIRELSLVSISADPTSKIRSHELTTPNTDTTIIDRSSVNAEIRSMATAAGLDATWSNAQIDGGATADAAARAALAEMATRNAAAGTVRNTTVTVGTDHTDPVAIRGAMADALAHRLAPNAVKLEGRAVDYRGTRILDMVGDLAVANGDRFNQRDSEALLQRAVGAHSTSDFPLLLADAANKALLAQYQVAEPTYRKWAARKPFSDFKAHSFLRVGDVPAFSEINESGEVKYGTISESAEKVTAKEYGTGIAIGRRALINDDLSALSDFSTGIAIRAANDENRLAYGVLTANAALSDGVALFHATHGNLPTAAAFSATTIAGLVKALRGQTSLDGLRLNLQPALLVVGPDLEVAARTLLTAINATKSSDVNPWANFAELCVDSNLGPTEHYLFASQSAAPVVVYGYVGGAEGPVVRSERDFDTQAIKVAASLDLAIGAIDFRGAVKNAGQ